MIALCLLLAALCVILGVVVACQWRAYADVAHRCECLAAALAAERGRRRREHAREVPPCWN